MTSEMITIETPPCVHCGDAGEVTVLLADYERRRAGAKIQEAYPGLAPALREQLMTGTHPACWTEMFG